jgi:uncharacterized protein YbaP (TraB family)
LNAIKGGFCLLAALLACSACNAFAAPKPLLWKVSDGDNHVYLLGSFHALKPSDYPLAASVSQAFADAETVAFEISPAEMESADLPMKMVAAAQLPAGKSLQQSLSAPSWLRLQQYADKHGMPLENFERFEPWFMSLVISMQEMALIGYDPKQGLDQHLIALSASAGKRTRGLETADEQIAALDSMSPTEQQQMLSESLDDAQNFKAKMDELHDDWRSGNDVALEKLLADDFKRQYAQLYQRINVARNQAWLPKIRRMLDDEHKDDTMVVVGSLHLLGADGLVSQLRAKGYRVERL